MIPIRTIINSVIREMGHQPCPQKSKLNTIPARSPTASKMYLIGEIVPITLVGFKENSPNAVAPRTFWVISHSILSFFTDSKQTSTSITNVMLVNDTASAIQANVLPLSIYQIQSTVQNFVPIKVNVSIINLVFVPAF